MKNIYVKILGLGMLLVGITGPLHAYSLLEQREAFVRNIKMLQDFLNTPGHAAALIEEAQKRLGITEENLITINKSIRDVEQAAASAVASVNPSTVQPTNVALRMGQGVGNAALAAGIGVAKVGLGTARFGYNIGSGVVQGVFSKRGLQLAVLAALYGGIKVAGRGAYERFERGIHDIQDVANNLFPVPGFMPRRQAPTPRGWGTIAGDIVTIPFTDAASGIRRLARWAVSKESPPKGWDGVTCNEETIADPKDSFKTITVHNCTFQVPSEDLPLARELYTQQQQSWFRRQFSDTVSLKLPKGWRITNIDGARRIVTIQTKSFENIKWPVAPPAAPTTVPTRRVGQMGTQTEPVVAPLPRPRGQPAPTYRPGYDEKRAKAEGGTPPPTPGRRPGQLAVPAPAKRDGQGAPSPARPEGAGLGGGLERQRGGPVGGYFD